MQAVPSKASCGVSTSSLTDVSLLLASSSPHAAKINSNAAITPKDFFTDMITTYLPRHP